MKRRCEKEDYFWFQQNETGLLPIFLFCSKLGAGQTVSETVSGWFVPLLSPPLIYALQEPSHLFWPRVGYRASQEYLHSCFRSLAIPITDGSCRVFKWASRHSLLHKDALLLPHSNEMARRRERHLHFQCVCVWGCVCVWAHVWESGCVCVRVSNANRPHPKNMKSRLCSKTNWIKTTNHRRLLQWPIL